jgi:hypothetical protein
MGKMNYDHSNNRGEIEARAMNGDLLGVASFDEDDINPIFFNQTCTVAYIILRQDGFDPKALPLNGSFHKGDGLDIDLTIKSMAMEFSVARR